MHAQGCLPIPAFMFVVKHNRFFVAVQIKKTNVWTLTVRMKSSRPMDSKKPLILNPYDNSRRGHIVEKDVRSEENLVLDRFFDEIVCPICKNILRAPHFITVNAVFGDGLVRDRAQVFWVKIEISTGTMPKNWASEVASLSTHRLGPMAMTRWIAENTSYKNNTGSMTCFSGKS